MELLEHLRTLRRRWHFIVLAVAVCAGAAAWWTSRQAPLYSTTITFFVSSRPAGDAGDALNGNYLSQQRIGSYARLVQSRPVISDAVKAARQPGSSRPFVTAAQVEGTSIMTITVFDADPERAAAVANAYATVFPRLVSTLETPEAGGLAPVRASVVETAAVPSDPVSPDPERNIGFGVALGLLLGAGFAMLSAVLDTSVKSPAEVERVTGASLLGMVPADPKAERLAAHVEPRSARAEAFRQIRTNVQFAAIDESMRSLVVTSAMPGEGKSTVVANLAITLAQGGQRVLVVDADLRRPALGEYFGVESAVGLTNLLLGTVAVGDAIQSWGGGLLHVLPSGPVPANPAEVVGSRAMLELIKYLEDRYDLVLFDAAPLVPVTDASLLAANTTAVLLVVRVGQTTRDQLARACDALQLVGVRRLGAIANFVAAGDGKAYRYTYRHSDELVSTAAFPRERLRSASRRRDAERGSPAARGAGVPLVGHGDPTLRRAPTARTISTEAASEALLSTARASRWRRAPHPAPPPAAPDAGYYPPEAGAGYYPPASNGEYYPPAGS